MTRLPPAVREKIEHHIELVLSDTPISSTSSSPAPDEIQMCIISPDRPLPQTELVGDLASEEYLRLDRKLWTYFSTGDFKSLETTIREEGSIETSPSDWKIVTMWFQALVVMHRDHNYHMCISELLVPALQLCRETESINATILEGRIYQRMVYLVMDLPKYAQKHFEMAKEELQWVSRGYDKANMLCREAKLRSATSSTPEERNLTEKLFNDALECVPEEAPYALASRPSLILSKAAFHLHISFGSTTRNMEEPPCVSPEEAKKAKDTLSKLDEKDILLSMRKCERQLLSAELLRLDGAALEAYASTVRQSEEASLKNLVSIAKCRMEYIRYRRRV